MTTTSKKLQASTINEPQSKEQIESKGFDLYYHLKQNILKAEENCKDPLVTESSYCIDCQVSTCPKCTLQTHKSHYLIAKEKYYHLSPIFFHEIEERLQNAFNDLKFREEYEEQINAVFLKLHGQLDKLHQAKLSEVDLLFNELNTNLTQLKDNLNKVKEGLDLYYAKTKKFFSIQENNIDKDNTILLMNYEMINLCDKKNKEAIEAMNKQSQDLIQYKSDIAFKGDNVIKSFQVMIKDQEPLVDNFDDFYWNVKIRSNRYLDHIDKMQTTLLDIVRSSGSFDYVNELSLLLDSKNQKGIDYIFNQNYFKTTTSSPPEKFNGTESSRTNKMRSSLRSRSKAVSPKKSFSNLRSQSLSNIKTLNKTDQNSFSQTILRYKNTKDIVLDTDSKQRFFSYSIIDLYNKCFTNNRHRKSFDSNTRVLDNYKDRFVRLKERAKPVIGTNEILIYDSTTTLMNRKKIQLEKDKHGYCAFPDGNRHIVINDWLYITGGVDSMKNAIKISVRINLITYAVERLPQMPKAHSYHSLDFLENYNCFIVIGGENNKNCELFDLMTNKWTVLPDLNCPRANVSIYFDQYTSDVYAMFGMKGNISTGRNYIETIEVMELNDVNSGWIKVDYYKSSTLDFKNPVIVIPFSKDKLLISGGKNARTKGKIYAFFLLTKNEIIQVDESVMEEIKVEEKKVQAYNSKINKEKKDKKEK